jgi:ribosomal protein S18 acetylase RimI-like enzyme
MQIRKATPADIPDLLELWKEFMDFHADRDPVFARSEDGHERFAEFIGENLASAEWLDLVAVDEGHLLGYCMATIVRYPPVLKVSRYGYVQDIAVTSGHRRRGIAAALYQETECWFREQGIARAELNVAVANEASQGFWGYMGYKDRMVRMEKILDSE